MASDTYQNRTTKQELTQKMKDLSDILNNSWDGIAIIDETGNFVFTNNAFTPILSYTKEELLRLNLINLVAENNRDVVKFALIKATKLGSLKNIKAIFSRKDKQKVYLELSLAKMTNGKYFVLNARDFTEKVAKDEIINKYVLSCQIDMDYNISDISDALLDLMGYVKNELLGQPYSMIRVQEPKDSTLEQIFNNLDESDKTDAILKNKNKKGDIFWLDTKIKPQINKYGDKVGYVFISFDVTDKQKLLALNSQLQTKLDDSEDVAKRKDVQIIEQSKFVALGSILEGITKNWLEPLKDIEGRVNDISKKHYPEDEMKHKLASIGKTIKNLSSNIEKFRKSFEIKASPAPTNIKKVLSDVIAMLERNNDRHQVVIHQDLNDVSIIESYPSELLDVILSIITNSLEAFRKRQIKNPIIDVTLTEDESHILIHLIDNAGGIPEHIIQKVFDPYFSTKEEKGKGMGLYFAKTLIENHMNGTISIENNDGYTNVLISIATK